MWQTLMFMFIVHMQCSLQSDEHLCNGIMEKLIHMENRLEEKLTTLTNQVECKFLSKHTPTTPVPPTCSNDTCAPCDKFSRTMDTEVQHTGFEVNVKYYAYSTHLECGEGSASEGLNASDVEGSWPWCDDTLGYLYINDSWYDLFLRTFNFVPSSRESIGTQFLIHTRNNRNNDTNHEVVAYKPSTFDGTGFDASKPTKFIIHGFVQTGNANWLTEMAQEMLDYGDYNVFRVNWEGGSSWNIYGQATSNTRVVGLEIGYLVNWMVNYFSLDPAKVHLIGHSLGSHVAGYAGEQITGLGRISGLDPAGPYFTGMPSFVTLDETDAIFVDNYHTDAWHGWPLPVPGYGTSQAMGNVDFYPNGGSYQPGCAFRNAVETCSHSRAIDLYRDTLNQSYTYIAHEYDDYDDFKDGDYKVCGDQICPPIYIGIRASEYTQKERVNVNFFFDTNPKIPYCCPVNPCTDKHE